MKSGLFILLVAIALVGCTTKSQSQRQAQQAYLAGQNAALRQQVAAGQFPTVTIMGAVQNSTVPWVAGLTLTQALATANYLGTKDPEAIVLTRQGERATLPPDVLFNGAIIPLEPGDVVEIH